MSAFGRRNGISGGSRPGFGVARPMQGGPRAEPGGEGSFGSESERRRRVSRAVFTRPIHHCGATLRHTVIAGVAPCRGRC